VKGRPVTPEPGSLWLLHVQNDQICTLYPARSGAAVGVQIGGSGALAAASDFDAARLAVQSVIKPIAESSRRSDSTL
jgi:hypothetical protein